MKYTIEAYDQSGQVFLHVRNSTVDDVLVLAKQALQNRKTGGITIYRAISPVAQCNEGGEEHGQAGLGLVTSEPPCTHCRERGGHNADCSVVS